MPLHIEAFEPKFMNGGLYRFNFDWVQASAATAGVHIGFGVLCATKHNTFEYLD